MNNKDMPAMPNKFHTNWKPALYERCENPVAWTYHIRFRVYETPNSFAFQFDRGIGSKGLETPRCHSRSTPFYSKKIESIWRRVFETLDLYKSDKEALLKQLEVDSHE